MTAEKLEKELKEDKLNSLYLLYGEERFLLETAVKKIKKLFGKVILGINYIQIDETNLSSIINEISMPAFGCEKKLIVIKNTGVVSQATRKKIDSTLDDIRNKISSYIKENMDIINQTVVIVVIEESIGKNELVKIIEENGVICNFEKLKPIQIINRLKGIASAYKVNITDDTLKYLVEISGTSMQELINEIRKLIEYQGENGTITKQDIDKLATPNIESVIFDLTDSLGKKEIRKALDILKELIYNKEPIQKIIITLYNHFKKLYIIKLAERYNKSVSDSLKLKPNQMFLISKYKKQSEYFKESEIREIIQKLIDLDTSYKSGIIDINIGLEAVLCMYCS